MNGHCSKDIVTSTVYTYNHGKYFCINILFVYGVCMFDGIAEHEGRKTELANAIFFFFFFFTKLLIMGRKSHSRYLLHASS